MRFFYANNPGRCPGLFILRFQRSNGMDTNNQRLLHTFAALADLGQEIADTADFEEMLRSSFHLLLGSIAIRRGAVAQYDRQRDTLRIISARGYDQLANAEFKIDRDHSRQLSSFGGSLTLTDATAEATRFMEDHAQLFAAAGDTLT